MKTHFSQYYRIGSDDLLNKFDDCVFIFDACSLLDIFRLKKDLVEDIFKVIEHYKGQIRVPYHAASEYFEEINAVIEKQIDNIYNSKKSFDAFSKTFQAQRSYPYITDETSRLLTRLEKQIDKDFSLQKKYLEDQLIYGGHQNRLSDLLDGTVLPPFTPEETAGIEQEGEQRYSDKIPPGWKDASKGENRYGDLINWKEILRFAKDSGKSIIFVSNDVKEDWVVRIKGKKVGVLPKLLEEFYRTVGNSDQFFHIYTLDRFLAFINNHDDNVISMESIQDIQVSMEKIQKQVSIFEVIQKMNDLYQTPEFIKKVQEMKDAYANLTQSKGDICPQKYKPQANPLDDTGKKAKWEFAKLEDMSKM